MPMSLWLLFSMVLGVLSEDCQAQAPAASRSAALLQSSRAPASDKEATELLTPCDSATSFDAAREISGWCNLSSVLPDAATCNSQDGCRSFDATCTCDSELSCIALGGTYQARTCQEELDGLNTSGAIATMKLAQAAGSCDALGIEGIRLQDKIHETASKCCNTFPSTLCKKNVRKGSPCRSSSEFLGEALVWRYCDLWDLKPSKDRCEATPGCEFEAGACDCKSETSCKLLGGRFTSSSCQENLQSWHSRMHQAVMAAIDRQTCEGVSVQWGALRDAVDWMGPSCCASGKSLCEELDGFSSSRPGAQGLI